jgi:hypothetical protein
VPYSKFIAMPLWVQIVGFDHSILMQCGDGVFPSGCIGAVFRWGRKPENLTHLPSREVVDLGFPRAVPDFPGIGFQNELVDVPPGVPIDKHPHQ